MKRILTLLFIFVGIILLIPYSIPFILALLTAILLEPVIRFLGDILPIKRIVSVTIVFILFLILFGLGGFWAITTLVVQIIELADYLTKNSTQIFSTIEQTVLQIQNYYTKIPPNYLSTIQEGIDSVKEFAIHTASSLTKGIFEVITAVPMLLIHTIVYLVAVYLFCVDLPGLKRKMLAIFDDSSKEKVNIILEQLSLAFVGFIRAQIILSFITWLLAWIGLLILGAEYAFIFSILIVIVDILPILGAGSFLVPWATYSIVTGDQFLGIGLIVLFVVITVVRRAVEPKILGASIGLSALATLLSMYIGFQLIGVSGLILGPSLIIILNAFKKAGVIQFKITI